MARTTRFKKHNMFEGKFSHIIPAAIIARRKITPILHESVTTRNVTTVLTQNVATSLRRNVTIQNITTFSIVQIVTLKIITAHCNRHSVLQSICTKIWL